MHFPLSTLLKKFESFCIATLYSVMRFLTGDNGMKRLTIFLALGALTIGGCATTSETDDGGSDKAVSGAIIGGILGGVLANNTGKQSRQKSVLGVLAGAAAGGVIGNQMDKKEEKLRQIASERDASEMEVERVREDFIPTAKVLRITISASPSAEPRPPAII
jgi:outer membrane lipoprotein SlyB